MDSSAVGGIETCASSTQYIVFAVTSSDYRGRMSYINSDSSFKLDVGANATAMPNMQLTPSALLENGAAVSSDKRLKFNEEPLINELGVIHLVEPVEYDQTYTLVGQYAHDTTQSHQCGFIAQAVQQIEGLNIVVIRRENGDYEKGTLRCLNYNVVLIFSSYSKTRAK